MKNYHSLPHYLYVRVAGKLADIALFAAWTGKVIGFI
jgi:hypothetical protein